MVFFFHPPYCFFLFWCSWWPVFFFRFFQCRCMPGMSSFFPSAFPPSFGMTFCQAISGPCFSVLTRVFFFLDDVRCLLLFPYLISPLIPYSVLSGSSFLVFHFPLYHAFPFFCLFHPDVFSVGCFDLLGQFFFVLLHCYTLISCMLVGLGIVFLLRFITPFGLDASVELFPC